MYRKINYIVIVLLLVIIVLTFMLMKKNDQKPLYTSSAIMEKISYIQELSLVTFNYSGVIGYKDHLTFMSTKVPMTEKSFLIKYNGHVKAGIDMKQASIITRGKKVHVRLPKPHILETIIDENTIQVFDESMNLLNPIKISDYQKAIVGEKNNITQEAINKGILTESSRQAHQFIVSFLTVLGVEKLEITEIDEITLPRKELKPAN